MGRELYQKQRNLPIGNPEPDLHNINAHTKFGENPLVCTQVFARKQKYGIVTDSVKNLHDLPISNPKPDLYNIYAHTQFGENPLKFTQAIVQKWKIRCVASR